MFGIKTKKDKRIEELENQLSSMYLNRPHIITPQGNIITLCAEQIIEGDMPADYAKYKIAEQFADEMMKYTRYDLKLLGEERVIKGSIRIVI